MKKNKIKIRINRNGSTDEKLWESGYNVRLLKKFLGFYIIGYSKNKK